MNKKEQKQGKVLITDPDNYTSIVDQCLDDKVKEVLPSGHIANALALTADLMLTNAEGIAKAYDRQNGLELKFSIKLAQEKTNTAIQFKPLPDFKDSASANLDDPNQESFDFGSGESKEDKEPLRLPHAPTPKALPAPKDDDVIDVGGGEEE